MTVAAVIAGLVAGGALWFSPVRRRLGAVGELLRVFRPLLAPVLVLVASMVLTVDLGAAVKGVVVALAMVLIWAGVVRPERVMLGAEYEDWFHVLHLQTARDNAKLVGAALVALGLLLVAVLVHNPFPFQARVPAAALIGAVIALGLALGARLVGYVEETRWRVALLLMALVLVFYVLSYLGFVGTRASGRDVGLVAAITAAVLLGSIVVEAVRGREAKPPRRGTRTCALSIGVTLALISALFLAIGSAASYIDLTHPIATTPLAQDTGARGRLYTHHDNRLEYRYAPVLAFTEDQPWTPIETGAYLNPKRYLRTHRRGLPAYFRRALRGANPAVVRRLDGSVLKSDPFAYRCPSVGPRSCLHISTNCPSAGLACSMEQRHGKGDHISDGAIYARELTRKPSADAERGHALNALFKPVNATARQTTTLVQYWFFYPYDEWVSKVLGARVTQRHESDWESVSVGFDRKDSPLFVAFSAHCGGTWIRWPKAKKFGTHPLVAVANGSQANYPDAGAKRPPEWTSCKKTLPRGSGALLTFAANVRDRTSDDWQWGAQKVIGVDENQRPMSLPGSWGGNDRTVVKTLKEFPSRSGFGPPSPPLQELWADPINTIFCGRYWTGDEKCSHEPPKRRRR